MLLGVDGNAYGCNAVFKPCGFSAMGNASVVSNPDNRLLGEHTGASIYCGAASANWKVSGKCSSILDSL